MITEDQSDVRESCADVAELLPWLLNGSLEGDERELVREHLRACGGCRRELEETALIWRLATRHVPSMSLAEYALGLTPSALDRGQIERHLAICPSCREEAELAASGETPEGTLDFASARARRTAPPRRLAGSGRRAASYRRLALAAAVAVTAAGALLFSRADRDAVSPAGSVEFRAAHAGRVEQPAPAGAILFLDGFESGTTAAWQPPARTPASLPRDAG